jgi:homoserine kinase
MGKRVVAQVPATTANIGPGFDALGMALNMFNRLTLTESDQTGVQVSVNGEGAAVLPRDNNNLVVKTIDRLFDLAGYHPVGLKLTLDNKIPLERGLGSSAAAIVGGLVAANALAGNPLSTDDLLHLAVEIEGHPDNVAAAFLGGVVIIAKEGQRYVYKSFTPHEGLSVYAVVPDFTLPTRLARSVLPERILMRDAVYNLGRVALLAIALRDGDWDMLQVGLGDKLHQPYRSPLIPGLQEIFQAAAAAGSYGSAISGSGPTVIAFAPPGANVGKVICKVFRDHGYQAKVHELAPSPAGAVVLE